MAIQFLSAKEVANVMGISKSTAYRVIKRLNDELTTKGYIIVAGKISKKYFAERLYGGEELMKPQFYHSEEQRAA